MAKKKAKKKVAKSSARKSATKARKPAARKRKSESQGQPKPIVGSIAWRDLTVRNADRVRDFYASVVGWNVVPIEMGGYSDYCMVPPAGDAPEAGVCHKRGPNADLPSQWLMYVVVADLDDALRSCRRLGGKLVAGPRAQGTSRFAVIKDPAGAVIGLYEIG